MGLCIDVLGIPLLGDRACQDARREDREDRRRINQEGRTDRQGIKQAGRTDRKGIDAARDVAVASYGFDPREDSELDAVLGGLGAAAGAYANPAGALGGILGPAPAPAPLIDSTTGVLLAGLLVAGAAAWRWGR